MGWPVLYAMDTVFESERERNWSPSTNLKPDFVLESVKRLFSSKLHVTVLLRILGWGSPIIDLIMFTHARANNARSSYGFRLVIEMMIRVMDSMGIPDYCTTTLEFSDNNMCLGHQDIQKGIEMQKNVCTWLRVLFLPYLTGSFFPDPAWVLRYHDC